MQYVCLYNLYSLTEPRALFVSSGFQYVRAILKTICCLHLLEPIANSNQRWSPPPGAETIGRKQLQVCAALHQPRKQME